MVRPIFIVGCPRSGTSLLRDVLHAHPRLAFPTESHFIALFYKAYGDPPNEAAARRLAARILKLRWVRSWNLGLQPADFSEFRSYREMIIHLYETYALQQNKVRWGDKTPQYVTQIPELHALFPEARIIHLIRDGRDVALSWLGVGLDPRNFFTAAHTWRRWVTKGRRDGAVLPPGVYREVRYEALLARPEETVRAICAFLDEPFDPAVFSTHALRRNQRQRRFGTRDFGIPDTHFVAQNAQKWKTRMSAREKLLFESIAGDLLNELGYETAGVTRTVSLPERVMWRAHHWWWWAADRVNSKNLFEWVVTFSSMTSASVRYLWHKGNRATHAENNQSSHSGSGTGHEDARTDRGSAETDDRGSRSPCAPTHR